MKTIKLFIVLAICTAGLMFSTSSVWAHGEKSLEPFVRMRTIQWYDVAWSNKQVNVNDELVVTGKFHVAEDWPYNIQKPDVAYLGLIAPGPVFLRKERTINGEAHLNSLALQIGSDYEFKIKLKARIPGRYHIHPSFNVKETGNIAGPGQWIEITGNAADFTNTVKTVQGGIIDLETYGTANGVRWHTFWMAIGVAWLVWWLRRPLFIPRYAMVRAGQEDQLVTETDNNIAKVILVAVPLIVFTAYFMANNKYPETIPLQASLDPIPPLPTESSVVKTKVMRAVYNIPGRALTMTVQVKNEGAVPIRLGEFTTGSVRFINPSMAIDSSNTSPEYLAESGLHIDPDSTIQPGATVNVKMIAADAAWENEHLSSVIRDADSRFGGLLLFFDSQGKRYLSSVSAPLIPEYE
jgi:methane/ammonia monooxygenase subunit B